MQCFFNLPIHIFGLSRVYLLHLNRCDLDEKTARKKRSRMWNCSYCDFLSSTLLGFHMLVLVAAIVRHSCLSDVTRACYLILLLFVNASFSRASCSPVSLFIKPSLPSIGHHLPAHLSSTFRFCSSDKITLEILSRFRNFKYSLFSFKLSWTFLSNWS